MEVPVGLWEGRNRGRSSYVEGWRDWLWWCHVVPESVSCLLDICASPSWWSSRLKQPCQLKTAPKAALELPAPPLSLFLTHSFVPQFLLPVSIHPLPIASCGFRTRVSLVSPQFFSSSLSSFSPKAS